MLRRPASVLLLALLLPASVRSDDDASGSDGTLFFSSYVEGSKFNKAFGIYNPTGSVVNLASYAIQVCFNGCAVDGDAAWSRPFPSGASVATGEEYVMVHTTCLEYLEEEGAGSGEGGALSWAESMKVILI